MAKRITPVKGHDILVGNVLAIAPELPPGIVQCCVTSPPYFGLRDYQTGQWEGGDPACDHAAARLKSRFERGFKEGDKQATNVGSDGSERNWMSQCPKCGAKRIDEQIGLEETPEQYIEKLVAVFREVKRVLRDDGTLFLNMGDSYFGDSPVRVSAQEAFSKTWDLSQTASRGGNRRSAACVDSLKPKDLMLMPWRLAIALQADGWYIRDAIIWDKPNPMPSSVHDRCTSSWEPIIMLSKSDRYFCDMMAVREIAEYGRSQEKGAKIWDRAMNGMVNVRTNSTTTPGEGGDRNLRSVWRFSTQGTQDAHFATFPDELALRCIKMGTSERGACPKCGCPWDRVVESKRVPTRPGQDTKVAGEDSLMEGNRDPQRHVTETNAIGWAPGCDCYGVEKIPEYPRKPKEDSELPAWEAACEPIRDKRLALVESYKPLESMPQIVLDPFTGSGTTQKAARLLGRRSVGIELNEKYVTEIACAKIADAFNEQRRPKKSRKPTGQKSIFD